MTRKHVKRQKKIQKKDIFSQDETRLLFDDAMLYGLEDSLPADLSGNEEY